MCVGVLLTPGAFGGKSDTHSARADVSTALFALGIVAMTMAFVWHRRARRRNRAPAEERPRVGLIGRYSAWVDRYSTRGSTPLDNWPLRWALLLIIENTIAFAAVGWGLWTADHDPGSIVVAAMGWLGFSALMIGNVRNRRTSARWGFMLLPLWLVLMIVAGLTVSVLTSS